MRSILITLVLLAAGGTISLAQCDNKVALTSSKTYHFDSKGALKSTDDEKTVVEFNKTDISVAITGNNDHTMTGKVKTDTCDWKVPFKDGRTRLHITLSNDNGDSRDFTITITGKEGKLNFRAESPEEPDDVIGLEIDKFEEKN
jgi:hypothetical protein